MGLLLDTNVLILSERRTVADGQAMDFAPWASYGNVYVSAMTASELLVGVHRAQGEGRRIKRAAFVESILTTLPILDFNLEAARIHAQLKAEILARGEAVGANDLVIAATALANGHSLLTTNVDDFGRLPGLDVVPFPRDA